MILSFVFGASTLLAQYTISTVAGGGAPPDSATAISARVPVSFGIALGSAGAVYFTSADSVLKVDTKGILTRVAGTGQYGLSTDGGAALSAPLAWPAGLALDASGNLFIAENAAHRVRKVSPSGIISTVAGTGAAGNSGDGGPAISAQLNWPTALTADTSGNLFIADTANGLIRKVSASGIITTVASGLQLSEGVAADASGNLFISDDSVSSDDCGDLFYSGRILKLAPDGTMTTIAQSSGSVPDVLNPKGMAADATGNLYVADAVSNRVFKISSGGVVTIAAGNPGSGYQTDCPAAYFNNNSAPLICPLGVAIDGSGNLYVADSGHGRIARISPQGSVANVVGDGTPGSYWGDGGKATDAALTAPLGVAVDNAGNLYVADSQNSRVRKVSPAGVITTIAGTGVSGYSGDGGPANAAQLRSPAALTLDSSGNLYIADYLDNRIRKISAGGTITTVAGRGDFNNPLGDGGPATSAAVVAPTGVAVDLSGSLYIAELNLVRKVSPAGIITTAAGGQPGSGAIFPTGVTVDAAGNLYIADFIGRRILKRASDGTLTTVAGNGGALSLSPSGDGGPATSATLQGPHAVAVDAAGNLYVSGGNLSGYFGGAGHVRKVTPGGIISTIAGNGTSGYSGDGGPAVSASFSPAAAGIAVDAGGNLYVADVFNNVVRVLRPTSQ